MALRKLIEATRQEMDESRPRWVGGTALPRTNKSGAMRAMKLRLKGLGLAHVVRMIDASDLKGAVQELTRSIADAEREGKDAIEYRRMAQVLRGL